MDPVSQGVLGAAVAQAVVGERLGGRRAGWLGALAGMAPDLDVLIRSPSDPLLAIEFHRHFTHSLAFIPIGGLLAAIPCWLWARRQDWVEGKHGQQLRVDALILAATTLGWATHGLLDTFTSYGTMLWWPLSSARVAWDWISVLDPLYTLILAVAVIWAARTQKDPRRPARWGLLISSLYMGLCGVQHHRAMTTQAQLAQLRGHSLVRGRAQPLFLTNLLWRSLYRDDDGAMHADALRLPWWSPPRHLGAGSQPPLDLSPALAARPELARFDWFADGWLYLAADALQAELQLPERSAAELRERAVLCDGRYSVEPSGFSGVFCLELAPGGAVTLIQRRPDDAGATFEELLALLRPSVGSPITAPAPSPAGSR
ncbi:metal-dependent hydrolase [Pseudenhygromyxa sp. WMMC2535]|uniref:metal-dependent hydrolase n=1 Tax=Pseudenhygromyxa sp. WMMC2535 TaxID=2712867 RepID=UPI001556147F|nr:metal-dependent hydrolase [Pseudenhygromyxa sp. WMMC2535]